MMCNLGYDDSEQLQSTQVVHVFMMCNLGYDDSTIYDVQFIELSVIIYATNLKWFMFLCR